MPCLQEELWLEYLRKVVRLAREAAVEDSSSDEDSSGDNGGGGSAGREPTVSLEDFEVGRGVRCRLFLTSAWAPQRAAAAAAARLVVELPCRCLSSVQG